MHPVAQDPIYFEVVLLRGRNTSNSSTGSAFCQSLGRGADRNQTCQGFFDDPWKSPEHRETFAASVRSAPCYEEDKSPDP